MKAIHPLLQHNRSPKKRTRPLTATECAAVAFGMRRKAGVGDEKVWKPIFLVCIYCNPLKLPKTANAFFGNPWRKQA
jgi:hypothetical protein